MPGSVVVDASFAAAWVLPEVHSAAAIARLNAWELSQVERVVPALFVVEAASICRKHVRQGTLTEEQGAAALLLMMNSVMVRAHDERLAPRAYEISGLIGAGRAYDSLYVALAEDRRVELWTGDRRLYHAARSQFPFVRWVGESIRHDAER